MLKKTKYLLRLWKKVEYQILLWLVTLWHVVRVPFFPDRTRRKRLHLAYMCLNNPLPVVTLETIIGQSLDDTETITLKAIEHRHANCSIFELVVLGAISRMLKPKRCFEIGTYDGRSSIAIAANVPDECKVYTLNLEPDYLENHPEFASVFDVQLSAEVQSGERWKGIAEERKIYQLFGNSIEFDFSPYFPSQFVFIDGAHDKHTVLSDSRNALKMVDRAFGAIVWHDATVLGVRGVLTELVGEKYPIYVVQGTDIGVLMFVDGNPVEW